MATILVQRSRQANKQLHNIWKLNINKTHYNLNKTFKPVWLHQINCQSGVRLACKRLLYKIKNDTMIKSVVHQATENVKDHKSLPIINDRNKFLFGLFL